MTVFAILSLQMIAFHDAAVIGAFSLKSIPLRYVAFATLGLLALFFPLLGQNIFRRIERAVSDFSARTPQAMCVLFILIIAARLLTLLRLHVPLPGIHDSFSYLLMGDTFAHGRLTNPPHPMWVSFETFHVNWLPTYSSMYPPAQGFVLALGQLLGHPWIGVLLSDAAMCVAIFWMLQAWMPSRWAFLGGALAGLKFGIASYWMNSYWGGAVAAIGGALVLGALARVTKHARVRDTILLGVGLAILANSRPYEGLIFSIPAAVWFLVWLVGRVKSSGALRATLRQVVAPLLAVLFATAAFIGYYDWRLTGNALLMPHTLNMRTYHSAAVFLWQHPGPEKQYRNSQFDDFYNGWERSDYQTTWADAIRATELKRDNLNRTFLWPGLLLAVPGLPFVFRDHKMRFLLLTFAIVSIGVLVVVWSQPHYAAPLTCVVYAIIVQMLRHLRTMRIGARPIGVALSRAAVLLLALDTANYVRLGWCDPKIWNCEGDVSRFVIADRLEHTPGRHLIMVRYEEDNHNIHDEWVYNGADIDGAKVLWARELDAEQNVKLFAYFKDRKVWLVTPDSDNTYLEPYTPPEPQTSAAQAGP
jgi:hypothetical protein